MRLSSVIFKHCDRRKGTVTQILCLFRDNLRGIADKHIEESMEFVVGSDYAGSHWLASFLTQALLVREELEQKLD